MKAANTLSERKLDVLDVLDVRLLMFIYNYYKNIYIYIYTTINIEHITFYRLRECIHLDGIFLSFIVRANSFLKPLIAAFELNE